MTSPARSPSPLALCPSSDAAARLPPIGVLLTPPSPPEHLLGLRSAKIYESRPTVNVMMGLPYAEQIHIMGNFLTMRSPYAKRSKIVAVDGSDRGSVQQIIHFLEVHLTKVLGFTVRTFVDERKPSKDALEPCLCQLSSAVQTWKAMWQTVNQAPPIFEPPMPSPVKGESSPSTAGTCVYIVPISPLMATLQATEDMKYPQGMEKKARFRWLASSWLGQPRPDITVNIHQNDHLLPDQEVLRLQISNTNAIILTKGKDDKAVFLDRQLRRLAFEVQEWLWD